MKRRARRGAGLVPAGRLRLLSTPQAKRYMAARPAGPYPYNCAGAAAADPGAGLIVRPRPSVNARGESSRSTGCTRPQSHTALVGSRPTSNAAGEWSSTTQQAAGPGEEPVAVDFQAADGVWTHLISELPRGPAPYEELVTLQARWRLGASSSASSDGFRTAPSAWFSGNPRRGHRTRRRLSQARRLAKNTPPDFPGPCSANDANRFSGLHVRASGRAFSPGRFLSRGAHPVHAQSGDPSRRRRIRQVQPIHPRPRTTSESQPSRRPSIRTAACARRALKATPPAAPAPGSDAAQPKTRDAIGTVGGAANGRTDAARDIAPARGSEHAARRGRATRRPATAEDPWAEPATAPAPVSRPTARQRSVRSPATAPLRNGGAARPPGSPPGARQCPGPGSEHAVHAVHGGRAASKACDDGRSIGGASCACPPPYRARRRAQGTRNPVGGPATAAAAHRERQRGGAGSRPKWDPHGTRWGRSRKEEPARAVAVATPAA